MTVRMETAAGNRVRNASVTAKQLGRSVIAEHVAKPDIEAGAGFFCAFPPVLNFLPSS